MKPIQFIIFFLFLFSLLPGQEISIIPAPVKIEKGEEGSFSISSGFGIAADRGLENSAGFLAEYCFSKYGIRLNNTGRKKAEIRLILDKELPEGHYQLDVHRRGIRIRGSEDGVFYGIQSLIQLMPASTEMVENAIPVPFIGITDSPRFPYRGLLLDVSRHFFDISFLEKCVDYAAFHKMNYFHIHLTDDQGWRLEIKKYPELTQTGAWRKGTMMGLYPGTGNDGKRHGGYYTQDEIRRLVDYAAKRYVTIIPEIEMPGHSLAALASYPSLGCTGGPYKVREEWGISEDVLCPGKDSTFIFIENVLDEVISLFPSEYIHIGGDECPRLRWENCPDCQARIKNENLRNEAGLQSYLLGRIDNYLSMKGRTLIGWDEILEGGLSPNAVVMSWRSNGEYGLLGAVRNKHRVIMSPSYGFYLDYPQTSGEDSLAAQWGGVTSVKKTYHIEPVLVQLTAEEAEFVTGGQANIWTEYMDNPSKVEYMAFPRLSAVSEVLWSPKEKRDWESFKSRMQIQYKRYKLWGIQFNPANLDAE